MKLVMLTSQFSTMFNVTPYVLLYLIPAAIAAELALFGWQRRQVRAAEFFSLMMAAVIFWSVCHALSVASPTLNGTLFWAQIQYGGIVLIGPIWLLFILAYAGNLPRITPSFRFALMLPAALSYMAVLTNSWHHLWWPNVALDLSRPFGSLSITHGLLFWLHYSYSYGCVLFGLALLIPAVFAAPSPNRCQARLLVLGALVPLAGNLAHVLGLRTNALDDPTPFLFCGSGLIIFYAALRYRFLDIAASTEQQIIESLPDGVVVLDGNGVITASNNPAASLLAATASTGPGQMFLTAVAGSPLEIDLRALVALPGTPATQRIAYEHQDGLRALELRLRPLYSNQFRTGSLLIIRDRSERAQVEQVIAQRLSELTALNRLARAANVAIKADDLVWAIIRELLHAIPRGRIAIALLATDHATLHSLSDDPRQGAPTFTSQRVAGNDFELFQRILQAGKTRSVHILDSFLAGTSAQVLLQQAGLRTMLVLPLAHQATQLGLLFIGHADDRAIAADDVRLFEAVGDLVTEAILRIRVCQEQPEASHVTSRALAMVSHELRTPQTSIIGFTDLLERGFFGELPEATQEPLGHIRRNSETVLRLINDILDFAKIEAGQLRLQLAPIDLPAIIAEVVSAIQPQISERGLHVQFETAGDLPPAYANGERLAQVLMNLISNAIKFTDQGSITIRTTYTIDQVQFSVTDTGIGIAPEQQSVLFQEFQQIENEHTRSSTGTGLGLAISRRLMDLMGGTLSVESTPGNGATFYGNLPIAAQSLQQKEHGSYPA